VSRRRPAEFITDHINPDYGFSSRSVEMKLLRAMLAGAALIATMPCAIAEPNQADGSPRQNNKVLQEMYGGVVANQTITVAGQDFYQYFVSAWRDKDMSERYAIAIHERPSARWGSQIWIEYAQKRIFQTPLPSSRARIKALTEQAAEAAYDKVVDAEVQRLFFREPDIGPDDF
jgi:curli production assembly/transport component CsgE